LNHQKIDSAVEHLLTLIDPQLHPFPRRECAEFKSPNPHAPEPQRRLAAMIAPCSVKA
jgi:hypothetical protein